MRLNRSIRHMVESWARTPHYFVFSTLMIVGAGLLGSLYASEIKRAFPFYCCDGNKLDQSAVLFWLALSVAGFSIGVRQWAVDCARARGERRIRRTSRELVNAVRTMPPTDFLARFGDVYRECEASAWDVLTIPESSSDEELVRSIKRVLRGFAALTRDFDDSKPEKMYAANIMVFLKADQLTIKQRAAVKNRLRLSEEEIAVEDLYGVLDLRTELSATTLDSSPDDCDASLVPLALILPMKPLVPSRNSHQQKWRILPGAPIAFVLKEADAYSDTAELGRWCEEYGDFTDTVRDLVDSYFSPKTPPMVRSFISLPIVWGEGEDEDPHEVPLAVLNIHRDEPNLLKEDGEPVRHFVGVTRPLRLLLMRLLSELHRRESKAHGTWRVEGALGASTLDGSTSGELAEVGSVHAEPSLGTAVESR